MKQIAYTSIILLILGVIAAPVEGQNRRRRSRPRPLMASSSGVQEVATETTEEKVKIIEECELSERPKPEGEVRMVSSICGKAVSLPKPPYPEEARAAKASGTVQVGVVIDEKGRVVWARAISGHPLLQDAARKAACRARYSPTQISGRPIKSQTVINYNFQL